MSTTELLLQQVALLLRDAGVVGDELVQVTAASVVEAGPGKDADPGGILYADWTAEGDQRLEDAKWGPSIGFPQIRSLKPGRPELATEPWRDPTYLRTSPANQAAAAKKVLDQQGLGAWTGSIGKGLHRPFIPAAAAAASTLANTEVSTTGEQHGIVVPTLTPPSGSLVAGLGLWTPTEIQIEGTDVSALATVLHARLKRSMRDASELVVTIADPKDQLLRSGLLEIRATTTVDGILWTLSDTDRTGSDLVLTFIDAAASALIHDTLTATDAVAQPPGVATRGEWLRRIVARHPWITVDIEDGAPGNRELTTTDGETAWQALGRGAGDVAWRRFATANRVVIGSDDWLARRTGPFVIREGYGGIHQIDFSLSPGLIPSEATVTCDAALWAAPPSQAVIVEDLGPASGEWLVIDIEREGGTTLATITLTREQPALPEPVAPPEPDILQAGANGSPGYDPTGLLLGGTVSARGFINPVPGGRRISKWGDCRSGLTCTGSCCRKHKGWDIAAARGSPIVAPKDGRVSNIVTGTKGYGNAVYIAHDGDITTIHAHCDTILVARGQQVAQGQVIATVGDTGNAKGTPPHNHTEVRVGGAATNPEAWYPL